MSGSVLNSIGRTVFQLGFEISPIVLTDGVAADFGGYLPIVALTEAANFVTGLLSGSINNLGPDNFFCHFKPMPGTTLMENEYGQYPFANQSIAANAVIVQPLRVSLLMTAAISHSGGNTARFATFLALKTVLDKHTNLGGTYAVVTPTYLYRNCVLRTLRDVSGGETRQPQVTWQWDFEQPLISLSQAEQAQNDLMSKLTNGTATDGATSGPSTANSQLGGAANVTQPVTGGSTAAAAPSYSNASPAAGAAAARS